MEEKERRPILVGFDRDDTLNIDDPDSGYIGQTDDWRKKIKLCPDVEEGLVLLQHYIQSRSDLDIRTMVGTNQAGVAKGLLAEERVREMNQYISDMLPIDIGSWQYAPCVSKEHGDRWKAKGCETCNDDYILDEGIENPLRKPEIGMLEKAAKEFGTELQKYHRVFFIGNNATDVETALNVKGNDYHSGGIGIWVGKREDQYSADMRRLIADKSKLVIKYRDEEIKASSNLYTAEDLCEAVKIMTGLMPKVE